MTDADKRAEQVLSEQSKLYQNQPPTLENARRAVLSILTAFLGVREIGTSNSGYWVDRFHRALGLLPGKPWCMMLIQYVYKLASDWLGIPDIMPNNTAGTLNFGKWAKAKAYTITSFAMIRPCDCLVWHDGTGSPYGHIGAVVSVEVTAPGVYRIETIEGNTSQGKKSDKDYRDGGTIAEKIYVYSDKDIGKESSKRYLYAVVSFDKLFAEVVK